MKQACNEALNHKGTDLSLPQNSTKKAQKERQTTQANKQAKKPEAKARKWPLYFQQ